MFRVVIFAIALAGSVSAQVNCINDFLDCADVPESETDTVRMVSMFGTPGDTVWLDVHFTVPNDSMSAFLTLIRYDDAYLSPLLLPPPPGDPDDTLWVAAEPLGALAQLLDDNPTSNMFWSKVTQNPFDSGAVLTAFMPEVGDVMEPVDEPLFRLPFVVDAAMPHGTTAEFWFHEVNEYILVDSTTQEAYCADCRCTNLAVKRDSHYESLFPTMVNGNMTPYGGWVTVDHVENVTEDSLMLTDSPIKFNIRMTAGPIGNNDIQNGFRIYSPDGANWGGTTIDTTGIIGRAQYDLVWDTYHGDVDGVGSDTVGLHGAVMSNPVGMPAGFDEITHIITIGPIDGIHGGKHICIDSCSYTPAGQWRWVLITSEQTYPAWDGPHCFTVSCCDHRADIDHNGDSEPDITDLIYLVTFMFQEGPEPPCMEEADINGDGTENPDISDLIYLVTYMFQEGPDIVPCP